MGQVISIVDTDIVPEIAADDRTIIKPDGAAKVMKFEIVGGELADADQSKELAVLHQFRCKCIRYEDMVPIGRGISIAYEYFYLVGGQLAIADTAPVLEVPQIVFIFSFGEVTVIDKIIT
jgi:hypothetical protein